MTRTPNEPTLRLAIPKGRMYDGVTRLLADAGIHLTQTVRSYRPHISLAGCEVKILKPQNDRRDAARRFAGHRLCRRRLGGRARRLRWSSWRTPVSTRCGWWRRRRSTWSPDGQLPSGPLVVASEYERPDPALDRRRAASTPRSCAPTAPPRSFRPRTPTSSSTTPPPAPPSRPTICAIVDELMTSSTRLYANPRALEHPDRREPHRRPRPARAVGARGAAAGHGRGQRRRRTASRPCSPCCRACASPRCRSSRAATGSRSRRRCRARTCPAVIPRLKAAGGEDIVVTRLAQIVP